MTSSRARVAVTASCLVAAVVHGIGIPLLTREPEWGLRLVGAAFLVGAVAAWRGRRLLLWVPAVAAAVAEVALFSSLGWYAFAGAFLLLQALHVAVIGAILWLVRSERSRGTESRGGE
jgi:hypothetical protein